jgi:hypothetical protein
VYHSGSVCRAGWRHVSRRRMAAARNDAAGSEHATGVAPACAAPAADVEHVPDGGSVRGAWRRYLPRRRLAAARDDAARGRHDATSSSAATACNAATANRLLRGRSLRCDGRRYLLQRRMAPSGDANPRGIHAAPVTGAAAFSATTNRMHDTGSVRRAWRWDVLRRGMASARHADPWRGRLSAVPAG